MSAPIIIPDVFATTDATALQNMLKTPNTPFEPFDPNKEPKSLKSCIHVTAYKALKYIVFSAIAVVILSSIYNFQKLIKDNDPAIREEKYKIIINTVGAISIMLWPVIWNATIGFNTMTYHPITIFAFFWPMVMNLLDIIFVTKSPNFENSRKVLTHKTVQDDSAALISIAFAIGTLLATQGLSRMSKATAPILMYALLLLIAFIIPTPSLDEDSYTGFAINSIQRSFFDYAIGFIIAGVSLNIFGNTKVGISSVLRDICDTRNKE